MTLPVTIRWYAHAGSSSGLHHDYHDNLYCLLRGRKRFRIFPPALVRQMHTHGEICMIHPNGRIVYKGQVRSCWQCLMAQHVPARIRRHRTTAASAAALLPSRRSLALSVTGGTGPVRWLKIGHHAQHLVCRRGHEQTAPQSVRPGILTPSELLKRSWQLQRPSARGRRRRRGRPLPRHSSAWRQLRRS